MKKAEPKKFEKIMVMIKHTQTPSLWLFEADESYFEERFEGKKLKTTKRTSPLQETLKKNIVCLYNNQLNLEYCVHELTTLLNNKGKLKRLD